MFSLFIWYGDFVNVTFICNINILTLKKFTLIWFLLCENFQQVAKRDHVIFYRNHIDSTVRHVCFTSGVGVPGSVFWGNGVFVPLQLCVLRLWGGPSSVLMLLSWQNSSCWCCFLSAVQAGCCCSGLRDVAVCFGTFSLGCFGLAEA